MHKKIPVKKINHYKKRFWKNFLSTIILGCIIIVGVFVYYFESRYQNRVYPGIFIGNIDFSGTTNEEIIDYWSKKSQPFTNTVFTFKGDNQVATLSGTSLDLGYDASLSAVQALSIARSGNFLSDTYLKYQALVFKIKLTPLIKWKSGELDNTLNQLAQEIDNSPVNALFEFKDGRVTAFKASTAGQRLDKQTTKNAFVNLISNLPNTPDKNQFITLNILPWEPSIETQDANNFGIKELIGQGVSKFRGSISGRIHNIALAASRINGVLIPPNSIFSFNDTVGDISAATGYKQAYVIKSGRTVLDDGGGVCQVSTTLFRAALNSGLPVTERHAHSYRVGYYEQGGWKPGFDATVYAPSYDLKIKNDTAQYILIQSEIDASTYQLTFSMFGQKDNRVVDISPVKLYDSKPAPPDLYQDDPTLPNGEVKQVDWAAPGIKASFNYLVTRNGETLSKDTFFSNFIPWQAVYLRGTKN